MDEIILIERFQRVMTRWWLLVVAALVGALLGYIFNLVHPPIYEATAQFYVSIDSTKTTHLMEQPLMYQYDEDLALSVTNHILHLPDVIGQVSTLAQAEGIQLTPVELGKNVTVERKHAFWELSYRSPDPQVAQKVTNLWAETGYQTMLAWKANGLIVEYVVFNEYIPAEQPQEPALFNRNYQMLAGAVLGLLLGIVTADFGVWPWAAPAVRPNGKH